MNYTNQHIDDDINPKKATIAPQAPQLAFKTVHPLHPDRKHLELFLKTVFKTTYGANLSSFYPLLVSITDIDKTIAVAGVRSAEHHTLFSEYYLDQSIEEILGVPREQIVEIGNLAPANAGQARWLIRTLTAFLSGAGFSHVVFTAVPVLRNAFHRLGIELTKHADASIDRLPADESQEWGTYYDQKPAVYSGNIHQGEEAFQKLLELDPTLNAFANEALKVGQSFIK